MFSDTFKADFRTAGRANGKLFEGTITAFYEEAAASWAPGTVVIDGGAHQGMHSRPMAALAPVERVIAVEASPSTYAQFASKIRNASHLSKIDLHHAALQDDPALESIEFHVSATHSGRSGLNPLLRGRDGIEFEPPMRVPATTIDKLAGSLGERVRFIKLDLEGGEFAALRGGRQTLAAGGPVCVFETGRDTPKMNDYTPQEVLDYMERAGLKVVNFFGEPVTAETLSSSRYAWAFPIHQWERQSVVLRRLAASEFEKVSKAS